MGKSFRRWAAVVLSVTSLQAWGQYDVWITPDRHALGMSLAIPTDAADRVLLPPRGVFWGTVSQISNIRCNHGELEQGPGGMWRAPKDCSRVSWTVSVDAVSKDGALASQQRSLSFGGGRWFLLSEPTSILRLSDTHAAGTVRAERGTGLVGASPVGNGVYRLPPPGNAPEFYVVGSPVVSHRHIGAIQVTDIEDDPSRVAGHAFYVRHAKALAYLTRVVSPPDEASDPERSLLVVWLGITRSVGRVGGAAGSRSFLANYVIDDDGNRAEDDAVTAMIIAHEQFHQLVDVMRGRAPPLAPWLSESLAQYYALKALDMDSQGPVSSDLRSKFIDPHAAVTTGLLELNRAYVSGDRARYTLFYSEGATFWYLVDQAMELATNGRSSLDDYIPAMLKEPQPSDASLPSEFVAKMDRLLGSRFDDLVHTYLSSTGSVQPTSSR
jgi:hypothetical protein